MPWHDLELNFEFEIEVSMLKFKIALTKTKNKMAAPVNSRGAGPRTRIVLINEDILVNEDNFVCSKIRIVCIFEDVFFSLELWGSRVTDRALETETESAKNGFLVKIYF